MSRQVLAIGCSLLSTELRYAATRGIVLQAVSPATAATLWHGYKTTPGSQPFSHPDHHLPEFTLGHLAKSARHLTCRTMSGVAHTSNRVSLRTRRRPGAGALSDEHRRRRQAGDFSHLAPILPENNRSPSPVPDHNKDLPHIPSTSTGLWGDEAVTILTEATSSPTASPILGCPPLPVSSHCAYERVPITEAQQIAAQYRQRFRNSLNAPQSTEHSEQMTLDVNTGPFESSHAFPTRTAMQSGVSTHTRAMNAPVGASLAFSLSPTLRALAGEIEITHTPHGGTSPFNRVHEDGTVSCTRGDCLAILPNLRAFLCHLHIHLIHEGYVIYPRCV